MLDLRCARIRRRGIFWPPYRGLLGLGREQELAMIEREPGLPLRIGNSDAMLERLAQRRQLVSQVGIFGEQRALLPLSRLGTGHVADKMHDGVAMGDVDIELVERVAAEVLEILLHLHFDIVPREVGAKLIAIGTELVGNSREKNLDRHHARPQFNRG